MGPSGRLPQTGEVRYENSRCIGFVGHVRWDDTGWAGRFAGGRGGHATANPKGRRTPLCLTISKDEGATWSQSRVIEDSPDGWYCYAAITFINDRLLLAYCVGDKEVGGLNRLKVLAVSRNEF